MSRRHNRHKFSVDIKWRNQQSELVTGELLWRALKPDIFKVHRFLKMISRFINSVFARRRLDRQWCCGAGNRWFTRCRCVIDTYTSARRAQKLSTSTRCDSDIIHRAKVFATVIQINKSSYANGVGSASQCRDDQLSWDAWHRPASMRASCVSAPPPNYNQTVENVFIVHSSCTITYMQGA